MLNFTVGPVQSSDSVRAIGAENVPYFRTAEFSEIMLENERLMLKFSGAPEGSRAVFITGSGTASMEATIMNVLTSQDRALVVNGGSFGARFCKICNIHNVPHDIISLAAGHKLLQEDIDAVATGHKYTAFIVNMHETSTGVLYDTQLISDYCKKNNLLLIVDCISSFLCNEFNMSELGADVMIIGLSAWGERYRAFAPCIGARKEEQSKVHVFRFEGCACESGTRPDALYAGSWDAVADQ